MYLIESQQQHFFICDSALRIVRLKKLSPNLQSQHPANRLLKFNN